MDNYLGIAARTEHMAQRHEFSHQRLEIIDLAVIDDADRPILVVKRLIPAREVDDRQAAVAEPDARRKMKAVAVRPAMTEDVGHASQQRSIDLGTPAVVENTCYAAHRL